MTRNVDAIFANSGNQEVLKEFFEGIVSRNFFDGIAHQLYLDTHKHSLFIREEHNPFYWMDDDAMMQVTQVYGRQDVARNTHYRPGDDLEAFGFSDWIEEIRLQISVR